MEPCCRQPAIPGCGNPPARAAAAVVPKRERLWPAGAPGATGEGPDHIPTLTWFLPEAGIATRTAVVICPGGGYGGLATGHEGQDIGTWLSGLGITAVMLEYRMRGRGYGHPAPLQDAQHAIRTVRARAAELGIAPDRIGILGFSAGGHLASTAGTHFDHGNPAAADPVERIGCRPDFMILCYPVIAFDEAYTHRGSQQNLLGSNPPPELVRALSNEKQVTPETPPTFLFHTDEDSGVPAENSVHFYLALRRAKVPAELHIYRCGPHGVGLGRPLEGTGDWSRACAAWLRGHGWLETRGTGS
jgi:acetyl esterase/lipase